MTDCLQLHLFDGLGVEVLPESDDRMCLNHDRYKCVCVCEVPLSCSFVICVSPGRVLRIIFDSFGDLGDTVCDF